MKHYNDALDICYDGRFVLTCVLLLCSIFDWSKIACNQLQACIFQLSSSYSVRKIKQKLGKFHSLHNLHLGHITLGFMTVGKVFFMKLYCRELMYSSS
jgi:hypothetical protein